MLILMTTALAVAAPAAQPAEQAAPQSQHMAMNHDAHRQMMKCCDCCKDMAKEHEGHFDHEGHETR